MRHKSERGLSLIELMIAMVVLAVGLGGITTLLLTAIGSNNRNSRDTTATMLAQLVIEEIMAQDTNSTAPINITDCAGNTYTISVTGGAAPAGAGAALVTSAANPNYGAVDQTQAIGAVPAGYQMNYVDCSAAGGTRTTYDVRWNVMTITATQTRLITASARQRNSSSALLGGPLFNLPANLRGIGGHTQ